MNTEETKDSSDEDKASCDEAAPEATHAAKASISKETKPPVFNGGCGCGKIITDFLKKIWSFFVTLFFVLGLCLYFFIRWLFNGGGEEIRPLLELGREELQKLQEQLQETAKRETVNRYEQLKTLKDAGVLTEQEYKAMRETVNRYTLLKALKYAGLLTEQEYEAKRNELIDEM